MSLKLLRCLIQSNERILQQKLCLLEIIEKSQNSSIFQKSCPCAGASIGQHLRHSTDHMELAFRAATQISEDLEKSYDKASLELYERQYITLQYDARKRGVGDETALNAARERINSIHRMIHFILRDGQENLAQQLLDRPIRVAFLLGSENSSMEMPIISNMARELSFVAHHAIHHLALIKFIGVNMAAFSETDLPRDFGKASSTVLYETKKTIN